MSDGGFNDYEQIPFKGDPTKTNSPGTAVGFTEGADALPGGLPKKDDNRGDSSENLMNDQGGGMAPLKGM